MLSLLQIREEQNWMPIDTDLAVCIPFLPGTEGVLLLLPTVYGLSICGLCPDSFARMDPPRLLLVLSTLPVRALVRHKHDPTSRPHPD